MQETAEKREKWLVRLIFLLFFAVLLFQHRALFMGHDDYGYASLSYIGYDGPWGMHHTNFWNIFQFLYAHYMTWGGRVLYFFFEIVLLRAGIRVYRVSQSIVILLIFYAMYRLLVRERENPWLAAVVCLCYGMIGLLVMRDTVFWITASVLYLWPLLPLLWFFVLYDPEKGKGRLILCGILIFMAAWSQEQNSVLAVAAAGIYMLVRTIRRRRVILPDAMMIVAAFAGFLVLMLAPGQKARMAMNADFYNLSLSEKLMQNVPEILTHTFEVQYWKFLTVIFLLAVLYMTGKNVYAAKNHAAAAFHGAALALVLFVLAVTASESYSGISYFYMQYQGTDLEIPVLVLTLLGVFWMLFEAGWCFGQAGDWFGVSFLIGGILSEVCMVFSPVFPDRSTTAYNFVVLFMVAACFKDVYDHIGKRIFMPLLAAFAVMSLWNFGWITAGYYRNRSANTYNDMVLREAYDRLEAGEDVHSVTLLKLPDSRFMTAQPYEEDHQYIQDYMRWYYDLPDDFEFNFVDTLPGS